MNENTRTRTRSRRGRTATREGAREQRREALRVLLSRTDRGVLAPREGVKLRTLVEAEIAECETFRRSAGGQQTAALKLRHRIDAAEQAMREIEAERDQYAAEAEALRPATGKGGQ